jgi:hypothetical protein
VKNDFYNKICHNRTKCIAAKNVPIPSSHRASTLAKMAKPNTLGGFRYSFHWDFAGSPTTTKGAHMGDRHQHPSFAPHVALLGRTRLSVFNAHANAFQTFSRFVGAKLCNLLTSVLSKAVG